MDAAEIAATQRERGKIGHRRGFIVFTPTHVVEIQEEEEEEMREEKG
jgi:hypothetical protein